MNNPAEHGKETKIEAEPHDEPGKHKIIGVPLKSYALVLLVPPKLSQLIMNNPTEHGKETKTRSRAIWTTLQL